MKVTVSGIDHALQTVQKYIGLDKRMEEVARRLCEIAEPIISTTHGGHARVYQEPVENGYKIVAEGEDVLFIEFGSGNKAGSEKDKYNEVPSVVYPGSWSEAHGGEYAKTGGYPNGYWHFGGRVYQETQPHPSFYYAYQAMVQELPNIVREVFGK